jgi:glycosyltransferase involved in cell wall biosynthesis
MKKTLVEQGISQGKIEVVYNWSYSDDCIRLSDMDTEEIYDIKANPKKINVVYAGNIGKMQNVELVANTARIYETDKTINYYIIGDGANKECIKKIVEGLSNVVLLPMQDAIYAESIYAQADINVIPLVKGGIKTAFPSKTATILRAGKCTVFCIDEGSMFEEMTKNIKNIYISNNKNPESLYRVICQLRDDKIKTVKQEKEDNISLFSINNARRYVEIIEKSFSDNAY